MKKNLIFNKKFFFKYSKNLLNFCDLENNVLSVDKFSQKLIKSNKCERKNVNLFYFYNMSHIPQERFIWNQYIL